MANNNLKLHPDLNSIVIVGCQRSGTTLLGQLLGAQENCFLIDEFEGLYPWFHSWMSAQVGSVNLLDEVVVKSAKKYKDLRRHYLTHQDLLQKLIIAKAPNLTYNYLELLNHTPKPDIVFMVRDSRAVVSSMLKLSHIDMAGNQLRLINKHNELKVRFTEDVMYLQDQKLPLHVRLAYLWNIKSGMYHYYINNNLKPILVKYESLVISPIDSLKKIFNYVSFGFNENVIEHNTVMTGLGPGNTSREMPINSQSLNKWKHELTQNQAADILEITGDLMNDFGYRP